MSGFTDMHAANDNDESMHQQAERFLRWAAELRKRGGHVSESMAVTFERRAQMLLDAINSASETD